MSTDKLLTAGEIKMDELGTLLNHETNPHCCGCWTIQYGNNGVVLRAMCNECGKIIDLLPMLVPVEPQELAEAVKRLVRSSNLRWKVLGTPDVRAIVSRDKNSVEAPHD